jgi:hypothetical protein
VSNIVPSEIYTANQIVNWLNGCSDMCCAQFAPLGPNGKENRSLSDPPNGDVGIHQRASPMLVDGAAQLLAMPRHYDAVLPRIFRSDCRRHSMGVRLVRQMSPGLQ